MKNPPNEIRGNGGHVKSMSTLFLREIGEPAQMALLEPNRNLVIFMIVTIFSLN
jgi:hypothetical protein